MYYSIESKHIAEYFNQQNVKNALISAWQSES